MPEGPHNLFQRIGTWVVDLVEWLEANLHDPAVAARIRADLGLDPSRPAPAPHVDPARRAKIEEFVAKEDIDEIALAAALADVVAVLETVWAFVESAKNDDIDGWDLVHLIFKVWVADTLKLRNPSAYAVCQLVGLITSEEETLDQLDPAPLLRTLRGEGAEAGTTPTAAASDQWIDRLSALTGAAVIVTEHLWAAFDHTIDAYYGADPGPGEDPRSADAASRALTVILREGGGDVDPALTLIGVHGADGGQAGLLFSLSAHVVHTVSSARRTITLEAGANGAFSLFVPMTLAWLGPLPLPSVPATPRLVAGFNPSLELSSEPKKPERPAFVVGPTKGTRLEVMALALGVRVDADSAGVKLTARDGKLVLTTGNQDGFLRALLGEGVEAPFDVGLLLDTATGARLDGGTGLKVNLPIAKTVLGITIHYLELELRTDRPAALTLHTGISLTFGPFQAAIDRMGLVFDIDRAIRGQLPDAMRPAPPKGIGLALDAGAVKGAGYLYIDRERGEYAGALELRLTFLSVKALGIITTKRPDGTDGWSLLLALYAEFSFPLFPGIFLSGLGGLLGVHRAVEPQALAEGLKTGALDDVLFPANPVADAPRILQRFRTLFPLEEGALTIGVMLQLSFAKPAVARINLGLILTLDNALSEDRSTSVAPVVLIGQLLVELPPRGVTPADKKVPRVVKLTVDILGFYDQARGLLLIRARLRDSFVGLEGLTKITLDGDLVVIMSFGASGGPFLLSAGGFHPSFKDFPEGTPQDLSRLSVSYSVGLIKLQAQMYFAITSNSVQAGMSLEVKATIGVASIQGRVAFDAIVYLSPRFRFLIDLVFQVGLRAFGRSIASVRVTGALEGPGQWRFKGSFAFSILWWDYEIDFDESWGSTPVVDAGTVSAAAALLADLRDPSRVEPGPPVGGRGLVSLAAPAGEVLAHPLGALALRQKVAPFGVPLDRIGTQRLTEGTATFTLEQVQVSGASADHVEAVQDHFPRGHYMELSDEQKLAARSFEPFDAGVQVGSPTYTIPGAGTPVTARYERKFLEPAPTIIGPWKALAAVPHALPFTVAEGLTTLGAAGLSARARSEALLSAPVAAVRVGTPALAVVDAITLHPVLTGLPGDTPTLAEQAAGPGTLVIEEALG